ncbi:hypothetical protein ONZ45_g17934 [Pleurotus djamor]|nr:hypothetical protein ONZ45_g17934 [Pleurotus djamor]
MRFFSIFSTLIFTACVSSSPVPSPEPIDPGLANAVAINYNLGCINECPSNKTIVLAKYNNALSSSSLPSAQLVAAAASALVVSLL